MCLDYAKIENNIEEIGNPLLDIYCDFNNNTGFMDDIDCRESLTNRFRRRMEDMNTKDVVDFNKGDSLVKINMEISDPYNEKVFIKNPEKVDFTKWKNFVRRYINTSLEPFFKKKNIVNTNNISLDCNFDKTEFKDDSIYYILQFRIDNEYLLSHQKISYVIGMARAALGAVVFDSVKNRDKFMELSDVDMSPKVFENLFFNDDLDAHPVCSSTIGILKEMFTNDKLLNDIFTFNNNLEKSWFMNIDSEGILKLDEGINTDDLGFINACE